MQKKIPILFSTPMVQALLAGRKTQTRRAIRLNHNPESVFLFPDSTLCGILPNGRPVDIGPSPRKGWMKCPYGKPGDLLWVRESWASTGIYPIYRASAGKYWLDENYGETNKLIKWKPSIHMPKSAARIWLQVEDVRVERLQDITEDDAQAEGVNSSSFQYQNYHRADVDVFNLDKAYSSFMSLWWKLNGPESWEFNPWVWAVSFKILSTTGKPAEKEEATS